MNSQEKTYKERINKGVVTFGNTVLRIKQYPSPDSKRVGQLLHLSNGKALHISGLFTVGAGVLSGDVVKGGTKYPFLLKIKDNELLYKDDLIQALQAGGYISTFDD